MERGILLINFLPDFWDMIEAYHVFAPKGPSIHDTSTLFSGFWTPSPYIDMELLSIQAASLHNPFGNHPQSDVINVWPPKERAEVCAETLLLGYHQAPSREGGHVLCPQLLARVQGHDVQVQCLLSNNTVTLKWSVIF